tara:strand:- start:401 stop:583 length:183 start_codon:yes stop_codon:yes gene_type:complete
MLYAKSPDYNRYRAMDYSSGVVTSNLIRATMFTSEERASVNLDRLHTANPGWSFEWRACS